MKIVLFGLYREKLPKEARGEAELNLSEEATIGDALAQLEINRGALCILNGQIVSDKDHRLQEGDRLQVVPPIGGGES